MRLVEILEGRRQALRVDEVATALAAPLFQTIVFL